MNERVASARERVREVIRDRRKEPVAGPFWDAIDLLCALERAEAGLHWTTHLEDHDEGMCGRCYMEAELEAACTAIEGER